MNLLLSAATVALLYLICVKLGIFKNPLKKNTDA